MIKQEKNWLLLLRQLHSVISICPVYQNVTASAIWPSRNQKNLIIQLTAPVKWTQSVQQMIADGATLFTEVGPGSISGLIGKLTKKLLLLMLNQLLYLTRIIYYNFTFSWFFNYLYYKKNKSITTKLNKYEKDSFRISSYCAELTLVSL
jgi:hypothetical protein